MSSFIDSIKSALLFWKKGAILGVDIGTAFIKVVLIEKVDEKVILRNYGELALGPSAGMATGQSTNLPPAKIAEELRALLKEAKISPSQTFVAIPFSASLLSIVDLPDIGKKELETMIPIEARRYIPVPLNEVSLDWWVLPKHIPTTKVEQTPTVANAAPVLQTTVEVIIAAIHNEVIERYESIKRNAQISGGPSHFEIEIFSTLRAVVGRDLSPILVIDLGASSTKLALVHEGFVHASHVISMGAQDISLGLSRSQGISFAQAEEIKCRVGMIGDEDGRDVLAVAEILLVNIMNEATRFVEGYEQKHGTKIAKVILVGGGARLLGLEKVVAQSFPGAVIEKGDPFARVDTAVFLGKTLKEIGPDFATALGIALKGLE
jgi:type IV pilus assembly protein PilM